MCADTHFCMYGENCNNYDENIRCHCKKFSHPCGLGTWDLVTPVVRVVAARIVHYGTL